MPRIFICWKVFLESFMEFKDIKLVVAVWSVPMDCATDHNIGLDICFLS